MITYKVRVREVLERVVDIKADTSCDAIQKAKEMYRSEKIILDSSDFTGMDFLID